MNYEIIKNKHFLEEFVDSLPDNLPSERYYLSLFARKKYNPIIKSDKSSLKRTIAKKQDIINKINQFQIPLGTYKIDGIEVPEDSLAVYITTNPRNIKAASFLTIESILDDVKKNKEDINPYSHALNAIQKCKSRSFFITFDCDDKSKLENVQELIGDILNPDQYQIIETRGGFHFMVKLNLIEKNKNWYTNLVTKLNPDQKGDLLSPVPGCLQGNFTPKFFNYKKD
jgi:hypothetical protein